MSLDLLANFDDELKPADPMGGVGIDTLNDGDYEFQITKAELATTKKTGDIIFKIFAEVVSPGEHEGTVVERASFLKDQDGANRLARDLLTLGVDTDKWNAKNGRRFSEELPKCIRWLKGMKFAAKKTHQDDKTKNKTYHNIYINKRSEDGIPAKIEPAQLDQTDPDAPF